MFGIGFQKLLLLAVIIAVVWYGFKYLGRLNRVEKGERRQGERTMGERLRRAAQEKTKGKAARPKVEDTEKCPACGVYFTVESGHHCGKKNCPY